jgi:hypothetical protein
MLRREVPEFELSPMSSNENPYAKGRGGVANPSNIDGRAPTDDACFFETLQRIFPYDQVFHGVIWCVALSSSVYPRLEPTIKQT